MKKATNETIKKNKNILYTGFGDKGTTTLFNCDQQRISKSSNIIEALGTLDELNAYLGIVKVNSLSEKIKLQLGNKNILLGSIISEIQQVIFILQAEVGGSKITVGKKELKRIETIINEIGNILPPIKTFTISGGSILSAELDYSRTLARKAERSLVSVSEGGVRVIGIYSISYMNRLSSLLFAMSRYSNYVLSIPETHPQYNKK